MKPRFALAALALGAMALEAASQTVVPVERTAYHVPVFSNDRVTVLDVFIPPQRNSGYHRHSLDTVGVLLADTERTGQVLGGAPTQTARRERGSVAFTAYGREPVVHVVSVSGDTPFHNIVVELLKPSGDFAPGSRDGVAGYTQVLDNERVRVWRLVLEPGAQAPGIVQRAPGIRVVVDGGELVERVPDQPDRAMWLRPGDFFWQDASVTRAVHNAGATRIEIVEIELK